MTYNPTPAPPLKLRGGEQCTQVYCLNSLTPKLLMNLLHSFLLAELE